MKAAEVKDKMTVSGLETRIVIEEELSFDSDQDILESDHPHCVLPPYYFEHAIARRALGGRKMFSIATWDGRDVFSVVRA